MKFESKQTVIEYCFSDEDHFATVHCHDGLVQSIMIQDVQYFDDGDAENGPRLGCDLSDMRELPVPHVYEESKLIDEIDEILNACLTYENYLENCNEE